MPGLPSMSLSLPGKSRVSFSDRPYLTIAVDRDVKHKTKMKLWTFEPVIDLSFLQYPFFRIKLLHLTIVYFSIASRYL